MSSSVDHPQKIDDFVQRDPLVWGAYVDEMRTFFRDVLHLIVEDEEVLFMDLVSRSRNHAFISGPSGAGKGRIVAGIEALKQRREEPGKMLTLNCAAIGADIFESEMFGHVKGSFTSADRTTKGIIQSADGGRIFLDEINAMPSWIQAKLLRVLEEGKVRQVGAVDEQDVSVQVLAASSDETNLRFDLAQRLSANIIEVPAFDERSEQTKKHIMKEMFERAPKKSVRDFRGSVELADGTLECLLHENFPGNIRQVGNVTSLAYALAEYQFAPRRLPSVIRVTRDHAQQAVIRLLRRKDPDVVPSHFRSLNPDQSNLDTMKLSEIFEQAKYETFGNLLRNVMRTYDFNQTRIAEAMGIARPCFHNYILRFARVKGVKCSPMTPSRIIDRMRHHPEEFGWIQNGEAENEVD